MTTSYNLSLIIINLTLGSSSLYHFLTIETDVHSAEVQAGAAYRLSPMVSMKLGYAYFWQESDGTFVEDVIRNQAIVSITARRP